MASDLIENYDGQPGFKFFRDFNADCDWSEALMGEIGRYIVVARRAGESYFIGAGTDSEARTPELPSLSSPRARHIQPTYMPTTSSRATRHDWLSRRAS